MTTGLICRSQDGAVIIDMTVQIPRILGSFQTGTANGSFASGVLPGAPFYIQVPDSVAGFSRFAKRAAVVYDSTGYFSWVFSYDTTIGNYSVNSTVYYGVY